MRAARAWRSSSWNRCWSLAARRFAVSQAAEEAGREFSPLWLLNPGEEAAFRDFAQLRESVVSKPDLTVRLLELWLKQGNALSRENVSELVDCLGANKRGLALIGFARRNGIVKLQREDLVRELTVTCRVYGTSAAEKLFRSLYKDDDDDDELLIAGFITVLVTGRDADRAEKWIKRLRRPPRTPGLWSAVISVYWSLDMHEKVLDAYHGLRASKLEPTLHTLVVMLKYKARMGEQGVEDVGKRARAAVRKIDVESASVATLNEMMEIYGHLGELEMVERVWDFLKTSSRTVPLVDSHKAAMTAFGNLGKVDKARQVLKELLENIPDKRSNPYFRMINIYGKLGIGEKAEAMIRTKIRGDRFFADSLICYYISRNRFDIALQVYDQQNESCRKFVSYETVLGMLRVFERNRNAMAAKTLIYDYHVSRAGDVHVFNGLVRVCIAAEKIPRVLHCKRFDSVEPNDETMVLLMRLHAVAPILQPWQYPRTRKRWKLKKAV